VLSDLSQVAKKDTAADSDSDVDKSSEDKPVVAQKSSKREEARLKKMRIG
jgi:hypothetical protein